MLNLLLAAYSIYADAKVFSLNKIYWIFNFVFLAAVPLLQYLTGAFAWHKTFMPSTIFKANALILSCNILYALLRTYQNKAENEQFSLPSNGFMFRPSGNRVNAFLIFVILADLLLIVLEGRGLFLRSIPSPLSEIKNTSVQLLLDKSLKGISLMGLLVSVHLWQAKRLSHLTFTLLLLLSLVANFPLAMPRYWTATFYLALLLSVFTKTVLRHKYIFANGLLVLSLLLFPLLSIFRYKPAAIKTQFGSLKEVFLFSYKGGDFDAYSSLCSTIEYVASSGITWGKQLLTVLLFFVPRSWWPSKGVGSGALVNQLPGSDFSNFCSPFIAEGYINFGIAGALLFIMVLGWLINRYDAYYWRQSSSNFHTVFHPIALGMLFFMLRGDLLSSFAYFVGIYVSAYTCYRVLCQSKKST